MATIHINCPACGKTLEVDADAAGKEVECGECFEVFVAKAPESKIRGETSSSGKIPAAKPASKPARKPTNKPSRSRDYDDDGDDDDYDTRPARRRRDDGGDGQTSGTAVAGLVLGIIAVLVSCCPFVGLPLGLLALILGFIGKNQSGGFGMGVAGIVLGIISVVISGGVIVLWGFGLNGANQWGN